LSSKLDEIWSEEGFGCAILYRWHEFLTEESSNELNLLEKGHLDLSEALKDVLEPKAKENLRSGSVLRVLKGFGFIKVDESEESVFFHANSIVGDRESVFRKDARVQFELSSHSEGKVEAVKVSPLQEKAVKSENNVEKMLNVFVKKLREFDKEEGIRRFEREVFSCQVCFEEKLGKFCLKFRGNQVLKVQKFNSL